MTLQLHVNRVFQVELSSCAFFTDVNQIIAQGCSFFADQQKDNDKYKHKDKDNEKDQYI